MLRVHVLAPAFVLCVTLVSVYCNANATSSFHIIKMVSWGGPWMADFVAGLITNSSELLLGYSIHVHHHLIHEDSIGGAVNGFIELISNPPTKIGIIGPGYSVQAKVIAETAPFYSLVQIGSSTTSPTLSDISKYPLFARTTYSTMLHNPAILHLLEAFNWKRVAKITNDEEYVIASAVDMQGLLDAANISTLASTTFSSDPEPQIMQMKESKAKIMLSFLIWPSRMYSRPLCRIYEAELYGPRYQWIHWDGGQGLLNQINTDNEERDGCTSEQLLKVVDSWLYIEPLEMDWSLPENADIVGDSGYTHAELAEMFAEFSTVNGMPQWGSWAEFDAIWSLAKALNASMGSLPSNKTLEDFTYKDRDIADIVFKKLTQQEFFGASGPIAFDEIGDLKQRVVVWQIRVHGGNLSTVPVGTYDPFTEQLTWSEDNPIYFSGGHPPLDSVRVVVRELKVSWGMYMAMSTLAALGIFYCVICILFSLKYRNTKLIKLSSPRINLLIAAGCALTYLSIILIGMESDMVGRNSFLCVARIWTLLCGFTFAFGSLFSKTWRVHVIFTNKKLKRKVVKDGHLFGLVCVVLLLDLFILAVWQGVDPMHWIMKNLPEEYDAEDEDTLYSPRIYVCSSKNTYYWTGTLYAFKALMLIFGIFFAWETRKVRIESLNDSKQIGMCVYNVVIMSAIAVPLINLLSTDQIDISFGVVSISILVCSTTTLTLVFASKMFLVIQHGSKVDDVAVLPFAASLREGSVLNTTDGDSVYTTSRAVAARAPPEPAGGMATLKVANPSFVSSA